MTDSPTFFINGMTANTPTPTPTNNRINQSKIGNTMEQSVNDINSKLNNMSKGSFNNRRNILNKQREIAKDQALILQDLNREKRRMDKRQRWKNRRDQRDQRDQSRRGSEFTRPNQRTFDTRPGNVIENKEELGKISADYVELLDNLKKVDKSEANALDLKNMKELIVKLHKYIKDLNQTFTLTPSERVKYLDNLIAKFKANSNFSNKLAVIVALNKNNKLSQKNYKAVITNSVTNKPTNNTNNILTNLESILGENVKNVETYFKGNNPNSKPNIKSNIKSNTNPMVSNNTSKVNRPNNTTPSFI
jgi:hypothetical protein